MFKFSKAEDHVRKQCTPNILPCRIHNDGPVDASPRYWAPQTAVDGKLEAYFRGRKLRGQEIEVPHGYRGVVIKEAGKDKTTTQCIGKGALRREERDEGVEEQEEITSLTEMGSFNNIIVWNHESTVNEDEAFVKGLNEWISFAEAVSYVFSAPNGDIRKTITDMT